MCEGSVAKFVMEVLRDDGADSVGEVGLGEVRLIEVGEVGLTGSGMRGSSAGLDKFGVLA